MSMRKTLEDCNKEVDVLLKSASSDDPHFQIGFLSSALAWELWKNSNRETQILNALERNNDIKF